MKSLLVFIALGFSVVLNAQTIGWQVDIDLADEPHQFAQIKNLSTIELPSVVLGGERLHSLSSLAYSKDDEVLYAMSDKGTLFWFKINFTANGVLQNLKWLATYKLKDKKGVFLKGKKNSDSEGMDITNANNGVIGDSKLIVSFERKHRIWLMSRKGKFLKNIKLPAGYGDGSSFHKKNQGLETVSIHPQLGVLSSLERPAKDKGLHNIFAIKSYKTWKVPRIKYKKASLTAMQAMPDGDLLLLERSFTDIFRPIVVGLKRVKLSKTSKVLKSQQLAIFDNSNGWYVDNFEGLTHISSNRYCIVSDNNDDKWQRTLLTCFEVIDD